MALLLLAAVPAGAQQFGRWSWVGALGGTWRDASNSVGQESTAGYGEARIRGALGVNGFVLHPTVARFELGLEGALSRYKGGLSRKGHEWGFRAGLDLTPRGRVPVRLYARRRTNAYTDLTVADPAVFGLPDRSMGAGGRLRVTHGPLRGIRAGVDWSRLTFQDPDRPTTDQGREFLDWSRSGKRFTHHLRLQRRDDNYRFQGYSFEDNNLSYDLHARLGKGGVWDWSTVGYRRRFDFQDQLSVIDGVRTWQRFSQQLRGRDRLELWYRGGLERRATGAFQSHTVETRYTYQVARYASLFPFVGYGAQEGGETTLRSPRVGFGAGWSGPWQSLALVGNADVSYALFDRSGPTGDASDTALAARVNASARHGDERRLATEFEVGWTLNQLRVPGATGGLPPEVSPVLGPGAESTYRARLGVRRRVGRFSIGAWAVGQRREPSGSLAPEPIVFDSVTGTLRLSSALLDVSAQLGASRLDAARPERFEYWSVGLSYRPFRVVTLGGSYRSDRRELTLAPSGDGSRLEGRVGVWLGAFQLVGLYFQTVEQVPPNLQRENRSFSLTLARRFGGWLPIVTGFSPGGQIR